MAFELAMKTAALLFLRSYKPIGVYASQVAPTILGPYFMLLDLFDIEGYNYNALFVKRENMDRLIKRIEKIWLKIFLPFLETGYAFDQRLGAIVLLQWGWRWILTNNKGG